MQPSITPTRPTHIPDFAEICLNALAEHKLGDKISLGGAFALLHYLDYRSTYDVDAWWQSTTPPQEREQVIRTLEAALQNFGQVRIRTWGEVVSIELDTPHKRKAFSFQIADRSTQLQPSISAQWADVLLDSLFVLVASKMVALVERGAPRDFRDIHAVCHAGLTAIDQCWQLWQERYSRSGQEADFGRARVAIETHLERIEQLRPLAQIADKAQRLEAQTVRQWYREEFLHAKLD